MLVYSATIEASDFGLAYGKVIALLLADLIKDLDALDAQYLELRRHL